MIDGKVIAITGASSGIGKATALHLAKQGAKIVLGARRKEGLAELAAKTIADGGQAVYRQTNVSKRDDVSALVSLAQEEYGRLDVLFSNAGAMPIGPMDDLAVDDWEQMVDVNIKGVLLESLRRYLFFDGRVPGTLFTRLQRPHGRPLQTRSCIQRPKLQSWPSLTVSARSWPESFASASSRLGLQTRPSANM